MYPCQTIDWRCRRTNFFLTMWPISVPFLVPASHLFEGKCSVPVDISSRALFFSFAFLAPTVDTVSSLAFSLSHVALALHPKFCESRSMWPSIWLYPKCNSHSVTCLSCFFWGVQHQGRKKKKCKWLKLSPSISALVKSRPHCSAKFGTSLFTRYINTTV